MTHVNILDGRSIFDADYIPIKVMIAQHHNKQEYHSHSFYEFVYIDRGFSTHSYNKATTLLTPGDVFGMRPGDIHSYIHPKNTILYNCVFNPEAIQHEIDALKDLEGIGQIFNSNLPAVWQRIHLDPISRKEAAVILETMKCEDEKRRSGWELKLKSLLISFLILFSRAYTSSYIVEETSSYIYAQYMYKALEYIESNYTRTILVEEIAACTGLSTDYFSRLFKHFTNLSPVEYIKTVRLAKAAELLHQPSISVSQVALEVGFEDPGYFSRQFKHTLGVSPSQYQRDLGYL